MARGLCVQCYLKNYRENPENQNRIKEQKNNWYRKKDRREEKRLSREELYFHGQREAVLQRDNNQCTVCKTTVLLVVHHIDGRGRGKSKPNNDLSNLQTLCRSCHAKVHHTNKGWARHWNKCRKCKTTNKKHNAQGYCTTCYWEITSKDMVCSFKRLKES